ncbi:arginyl-tRNA synthetase [Coemansia sp. BCRC 34490]|nr:arginyl-tRNA synthetase [Coemansia sp. BCRC 34490]
MLETIKTIIAEKLSTLTGVELSIAKSAVKVPEQTKHGDFTVPVMQLRLKNIANGSNPVQLAQTIADQFVADETIASASASGPYINFQIRCEALARHVLPAVHELQDTYGQSSVGEGRRVVVDFSSPNIAKPFHVGHLRSTIIGNFVYKLHKLQGWDAVAMNYLGDWGTQYGLLAIGYAEAGGSEEKLLADPIMHLFEVYVAINKLAEADPLVKERARAHFKKMEDGDPEALEQWQRFRDLSIAKYEEMYSRLDIHFDVYSGESQVSSGMTQAMQMLRDAGLLDIHNEAQVIRHDDPSLGNMVVEKSEGTSTYLLRDIGAVIERYDTYKFDKMIYVVGSEQSCHLKRVFKAVELLGLPCSASASLQHVGFGKVHGMSTRHGNAVFLDQLLAESARNMLAVMQGNPEKYASLENPAHTANVLGQSCVYVQDMSAKRNNGYQFEWSRMLSFRGSTGAYLQYTHARLCSLARSYREADADADTENNRLQFDSVDYSLLSERLAKDIVILVAQYPDILASAMQTLEPCTVVQYLFALCHAVSAAWEELWVNGQPQHLALARMAMYQAARIVLANGLVLLGIPPLERM